MGELTTGCWEMITVMRRFGGDLPLTLYFAWEPWYLKIIMFLIYFLKKNWLKPIMELGRQIGQLFNNVH